MKIIVITGSTRGIGYGLAQSFLRLGCRVVISGRSQASVDRAAADLGREFDPENIFGFACDVTQYTQVVALWDAAVARFKTVDIWINNAGISNRLRPFWEVDPKEIQAVVSTNIMGSLYGTQVAFKQMQTQGHGAVYNLEGYGSSGGRMTNGLAVYGTTKAGLHFFNQVLAAEAAGTPVLVGAIQPGMVITDMVISQYIGKPGDWKRVRPIFSIIAERVDVVAPWIARQVLSNTKNGVLLKFLSLGKLLLRFITAPFSKREIFKGVQEPE